MATKKKKGVSGVLKRQPHDPALDGLIPTQVDWNALRKTAAYLEKAKLAEYVEMMNHPWKSIWLNLLAGLARGAGIVVGGSVVGVLLVVGMLAVLRYAFSHTGGMPIVGEHLKEAIGWILDAVHQHEGK